ncbi:Acid [Hortaea werneckii]|nr:Acid [Hortaea werneckii]
MKPLTSIAVLSALAHAAPTDDKRDVDTRFPYNGPAVPVGDWVDNSINGNGKGYKRLTEPPAVKPKTANATNNVNVISLAYVPGGMNIHYQTPFGLGEAPCISYGIFPHALSHVATGKSHTYGRTPSCSQIEAVTQCNEYFHDVQIANLTSDTTYYYRIEAANGTTESPILSFKTGRAPGEKEPFSIAVLNDMGYMNAGGTYRQLAKAVDDGVAFAWHGGDISYADDWLSGIIACTDSWPVCYNGSSTYLPVANGTAPPDIPVDDPAYLTPLPAGEAPSEGSPQGGDMSVLYESNWDLWQQWMNVIGMKIPYMVLPGNHDDTCAAGFDGPNNTLTAYLNSNETNSTAEDTLLTYYSCPPSQRNFTAYDHRFRMPGDESGGRANFWYSFDYGLAHFISIDGETDFAYSPQWPFVRDTSGNETLPTRNETFVTDSGPFGYINGSWKDNKAYEQWNWLKKDLESIDRSKTPWVIAMSHRPMYSSEVSSYQPNVRNAFQKLLMDNNVDAYLAGHVHWYERLWPLTSNGSIDHAAIIDNNTYHVNEGVSMTHLINGAAGNVESHSTLPWNETLDITAVLNQHYYGYSKLTFHNESVATWQYILGVDGSVGDELTLIKSGAPSSNCSESSKHSGSGWSPRDVEALGYA